MIINNSPWIKQLKRTRPPAELPKEIKPDVAIIGGGIAGVSTAYFTLKNNTDKKVLLLEAGYVAHGATGHNAGQIVSYFEQQFARLVEKFGLKLAARAQDDIDSAWLLLEEIYNEARLKTHFSQFTGYAGIKDLEELIIHLKNRKYSLDAGINFEHVLVSGDTVITEKLPNELKDFCVLVPHKEILARLETEDKSYVAAVATRKGVMNSASFTEELVGYLITKYPGRFYLGEKAPVSQITLNKNNAELILDNRKIIVGKVVLCTNGFEKIDIVNNQGPDINSKFHKSVVGAVGYMAGFLEKPSKPPTAISYLKTSEDPVYYYLTRRPYEGEKDNGHNLVSIGGPEAVMEDTRFYQPQNHDFPKEMEDDIDQFIHKTYKYAPKNNIEYKFKWHGLMGYTPSGLRIIGPEPLNPVLMYNLGCNGVGILPSIYGGKRISLFLQGKKLPKSIFDPAPNHKIAANGV
ncbi:MAG: FAD-binding oxidoreductase [Candidatus Colwellbacteria bacterium]|nr:FAD-binding oxidoreductase [Candidatus Colwellbacteria bacterium]